MNYSLTDAWVYVKTNWKPLLTGFVMAYAAQHYGVPGSAKAGAILKILGIG